VLSPSATAVVFLVVLVCSAGFPFLLFTASQLAQAKNPHASKYTPYECGMPVLGEARIRFDVKFYLYALLFLLFDIESLFLFPWAVAFKQLGLYGLVEALIFIGILAFGLVYAWGKKALSWQ
jgi:NADH-quinone oxidoreductase subunit A